MGSNWTPIYHNRHEVSRCAAGLAGISVNSTPRWHQPSVSGIITYSGTGETLPLPGSAASSHRVASMADGAPLVGFASKGPTACHPEPFGCAQVKVREASGVVGPVAHVATPPQIPRRFALHNDSFEATPFFYRQPGILTPGFSSKHVGACFNDSVRR